MCVCNPYPRKLDLQVVAFQILYLYQVKLMQLILGLNSLVLKLMLLDLKQLLVELFILQIYQFYSRQPLSLVHLDLPLVLKHLLQL